MERQVRVVADEKGTAWRVSPSAVPGAAAPGRGVLWLAAEAEGKPAPVIVAHGDSLEALTDEDLRAAIRLGRISGEVAEAPPRGRTHWSALLWLVAGGAVASVPLLRKWVGGRWRGARTGRAGAQLRE